MWRRHDLILILGWRTSVEKKILTYYQMTIEEQHLGIKQLHLNELSNSSKH